MKEAKEIKEAEGFMGVAILYKVNPAMEYNEPWDDEDPPAKKTEYVIVSAVNAFMTGPETYIFPADKTGKMLSWGEMKGSYRGGYSHLEAFNNVGYTIV